MFELFKKHIERTLFYTRNFSKKEIPETFFIHEINLWSNQKVTEHLKKKKKMDNERTAWMSLPLGGVSPLEKGLVHFFLTHFILVCVVPLERDTRLRSICVGTNWFGLVFWVSWGKWRVFYIEPLIFFFRIYLPLRHGAKQYHLKFFFVMARV